MRGLADTKTAFRQEVGDWKSGSVYIFVISTDAYTLFHGGFPFRFEDRQFEDIDCEDVNGVRYLRELLAAGEAGGGYVEYMFDNPAVEGDEVLMAVVKYTKNGNLEVYHVVKWAEE